MFAVHCPTCAATVLLDESAITAVHRRSDGHAIGYRCWCGTAGVWHARRSARHGPHAVDPR